MGLLVKNPRGKEEPEELRKRRTVGIENDPEGGIRRAVEPVQGLDIAQPPALFFTFGSRSFTEFP